MTDDERTRLADSLFAIVFGLRPDNGEAGQAWALTACSTALARAILASLGPQGDPTDLLDLSGQQVRQIVTDAQAKFFRDRLTAVPRVPS